MSSPRPRPYIPAANADTQAFWDGAGAGELRLQRCSECRTYRHPPGPICPKCLSDKHEWIKASGRGTVYTFVVVRQAMGRGWGDRIPYVVAVVELEEGPHYLTNIVNIAVEEVAIGMPVEVTFEELDGTTKLPVFQPR
jgi:uncharacterized OB-fold protein